MTSTWHIGGISRVMACTGYQRGKYVYTYTHILLTSFINHTSYQTYNILVYDSFKNVMNSRGGEQFNRFTPFSIILILSHYFILTSHYSRPNDKM